MINLNFTIETSRLYLVVDYINGGEIFDYLIKEGRFREERIRFYASELILALETLHQNGIIFRDLKPGNILLDGDGHIRLTNFGLTELGVSIKEKYLDSSSIQGMAEYQAPEIMDGKKHGQAADWWSLGVLLFEMFTGKHPFESLAKTEILSKISSG